jgi:hypothetical protein
VHTVLIARQIIDQTVTEFHHTSPQL